MLNLKPRIQNYVWGKKGSNSLVYQLSNSTDKDKTYAELWMGSYSNMPSFVISENGEEIPLNEVINEDKAKMLGKTLEQFGKSELPFLFKVLSVEQALSIQCHPDTNLAQNLHYEFPDIYKDPNAKPEMVIALTKFNALCNFCTIEETLENIRRYKSLQNLFKTDLLETLEKCNNLKEEGEARKAIIKHLFENESSIPEIVSNLIEELSEIEIRTNRDLLIETLNGQYPNDIGIIFSLLMNYVTLKPGESLVMNSNEPHAYLSGDCIECMKASDNTIRCGLTPKFKDTKVLISNLNYEANKVSYLIPEVKNEDEYILKMYLPQHQEFSCINLKIFSKTKEFTFEVPVILLVTSGNNLLVNYSNGNSSSDNKTIDLQRGSVIYIVPKTVFWIKASEDSECFLCLNQYFVYL